MLIKILKKCFTHVFKNRNMVIKCYLYFIFSFVEGMISFFNDYYYIILPFSFNFIIFIIHCTYAFKYLLF